MRYVEGDMQDPFFKDKWYKAFRQIRMSFDITAAAEMGLERPDKFDNHIEFFVHPEVDMTGVVMPKLDTRFKMNKSNLWNYPKLIEAFEEANPGKKFTRKAIGGFLTKKGVKISTLPNPEPILTFEVLLKVFTSNEDKPAHNYIRALLLKDGKLDPQQILRMFGMDDRFAELFEIKSKEYEQPQELADLPLPAKAAEFDEDARSLIEKTLGTGIFYSRIQK